MNFLKKNLGVVFIILGAIVSGIGDILYTKKSIKEELESGDDTES